MKKYLFILMALVASTSLSAQSFLNGSFEINTATGDQINLSNSAFNAMVSNCYALDAIGNLDLITSADYCSAAPAGSWYLGITSGDEFAMELSSPLTAGQTYTISFYERFCKDVPSRNSSEFIFGLSTSSSSFGDTIQTTPAPAEGPWSLRSFAFVAPVSGQYVTVDLKQNGASIWVQADGFTITSGGTAVEGENLQTLGWVSPNPATEFFTLPQEGIGTTVTLTDMQGKTILTIPAYSQDMGEISVKDLPAGLYLVRMTSDDGRQLVQRMLKAGW